MSLKMKVDALTFLLKTNCTAVLKVWFDFGLVSSFCFVFVLNKWMDSFLNAQNSLHCKDKKYWIFVPLGYYVIIEICFAILVCTLAPSAHLIIKTDIFKSIFMKYALLLV